MKNFKATIQVAEDAAFRKSVFSVVEAVAKQQLDIVLRENIQKYVSARLTQPDIQKRMGEIIQNEFRKALVEYIAGNPDMKRIWEEEIQTARNLIRKKLSGGNFDAVLAAAMSDLIRESLGAISTKK